MFKLPLVSFTIFIEIENQQLPQHLFDLHSQQMQMLQKPTLT